MHCRQCPQPIFGATNTLLPDRQAVCSGVHLHNRADHLVSRDPDRPRRVLPVGTLENPQVGAADARALHTQQNLTGTDNWFGHLLDAQVSGPMIDSG